jgi:hypothetical protein
MIINQNTYQIPANEKQLDYVLLPDLFQSIPEDHKDWWQENVDFGQQLSVLGNHISVNSLGPGAVNELDTKVSLQHYVHLCSNVWHL